MIIRNYIKVVLSVAIIFVIIFFARDINIKFRKINMIILNKELLRIINLDDQAQRNSANVFFNLGKMYFQEKDFDKAILLYERGLQLNSFKPDRIFELACFYKNKGEYIKAFERFNQVLSLRPSIITLLAAKLELEKLKSGKK